MKVIVTGGAGFIGSALLRHLVLDAEWDVVNVDKLTYAGNLESLVDLEGNAHYRFEQLDICDRESLSRLLTEFKPDAIMHLAAESHVDRSIDDPGSFIQTNIVGTYELLEAARNYWKELSEDSQKGFRYLHVSTDEVYGSLGQSGLFTEETPYDPSSPYSSSKASSDHLARAWYRTFGLPTLITNCSNNYGPRQFPEKLMPVMILNALSRKPLPIYGKGENVRDWLYVEDHAKALRRVLEKGKVGETYNIGGKSEKTNIAIVKLICQLLDELVPDAEVPDRSSLITYVEDRPGHDLRYAIDTTKIERELDWKPEETLETGLRKTVSWYLNNKSWYENVLSGKYRGERLGLKV